MEWVWNIRQRGRRSGGDSDDQRAEKRSNTGARRGTNRNGRVPPIHRLEAFSRLLTLFSAKNVLGGVRIVSGKHQRLVTLRQYGPFHIGPFVASTCRYQRASGHGNKPSLPQNGIIFPPPLFLSPSFRFYPSSPIMRARVPTRPL